MEVNMYSDMQYDPESGIITQLSNRGRKTSAHAPNSNGYIVIMHKRKRIYAHRLAWILTHGSIPDDMMIDHINRDRSDNRLANLRLVDAKGNATNRDTSDVLGVCYLPKIDRWLAYKAGHKRKQYRTKEEAIDERRRMDEIPLGQRS
jgi:hypothetical protein